MTTQKQLQANRANAEKSTGPTSFEGRARSALNAVTHGLTARVVPTIPGEDPLLYHKLHHELMVEYDPQTALQAELVSQLAGILWRIRRVPIFEAAILMSVQAELGRLRWPKPEDEAQGIIQGSLMCGMALIEDAKTSDALGKLTRYERSLVNSLKKTLQMLEDSGCTATPRH